LDIPDQSGVKADFGVRSLEHSGEKFFGMSIFEATLLSLRNARKPVSDVKPHASRSLLLSWQTEWHGQ
jgi:hypothetical protein